MRFAATRTRVTQTFGNLEECDCNLFAFGGAPCNSIPGGRTEHAGGKAMLTIDTDGDGDQRFIL
jgi:hypothetical protein